MALLDETNQSIEDTYSNAASNIGMLSTPNIEELEYKAPTITDLTTTGNTVKPAANYLTSDTSVASQLSKLLSQDSDYMKQVDAKSKITASNLGMLSSDRYIGAATGAAIRESLPIATADAQTAAKFGLQQQQGDSAMAQTSMEGLVSGALKKQEGSIATQLKKTEGQINSYLQSAAAKSDASMANLNNTLNKETQEALKILENNLQKSLLAVEYDERTAEATRAQATSQIENTMIGIENLLKDPDILQLGSEAVSQIINNQITMMKSGIELTYNLAGLNIDSYVSDLLDTFIDDYAWSSLDAA
jgi:hypothetical protein